MTNEFEAIVAGGGVVGGSAALSLARAGHPVLLIDTPASAAPASPAGVVWKGAPSRSPEGLPIARRVVERRFSFLTADASLSIDYRDAGWPTSPRAPFVLETRPFATWFVEAARQAGATVWSGSALTQIKADPNGKVLGVAAGDRSAEAPVTLLVDPSSLALGPKAGLRWNEPPADDTGPEAIVETCFSLPASRVDDRFGPGAGRAICWEGVLGFLPKGAMAFGFLLPGRETVTAGVVAHAPSLSRAGTSTQEVVRRFEAHPSVVPYLRGGTKLSSSTRSWTPRGPRRRTLYGEGFLLAGEASGLLPLPGFVAPGMDLYLRSGEMAADTVHEALETKDSTGRVTSRYLERLKRAGLAEEMALAQGGGARFKWNPRLHSLYPELFAALFRKMMTEKGQPKEHMRELLRSVAKESHVPYTGLVRDALGGIANL